MGAIVVKLGIAAGLIFLFAERRYIIDEALTIERVEQDPGLDDPTTGTADLPRFMKGTGANGQTVCFDNRSGHSIPIDCDDPEFIRGFADQ